MSNQTSQQFDAEALDVSAELDLDTDTIKADPIVTPTSEELEARRQRLRKDYRLVLQAFLSHQRQNEPDWCVALEQPVATSGFDDPDHKAFWDDRSYALNEVEKILRRMEQSRLQKLQELRGFVAEASKGMPKPPAVLKRLERGNIAYHDLQEIKRTFRETTPPPRQDAGQRARERHQRRMANYATAA